MLPYTVDELIEAAGNLPPIPKTARKALALIREKDTNVVEISTAISVDQVLVSRVLRWANSAYYSVGQSINTVHQAIMVLGLSVVCDIILTSSISSYLNRPLPGYYLRKGELWRHSIGVALGARAIARMKAWKNGEDLYYAGLLCDIGKLAFEKLLREEGLELNGDFLECEREHFGIDHAALGAEMARRWHLPEEYIETIHYHHRPDESSTHSDMVAAIHVADVVVSMLGIGLGRDGLQYHLDRGAVERLGFGENEFMNLVYQVLDQIDMVEMFVES